MTNINIYIEALINNCTESVSLHIFSNYFLLTTKNANYCNRTANQKFDKLINEKNFEKELQTFEFLRAKKNKALKLTNTRFL